MKGYSTSLINDIKTIRYFTSSRMATLKKKIQKRKEKTEKEKRKYWQRYGETGTPCTGIAAVINSIVLPPKIKN